MDKMQAQRAELDKLDELITRKQKLDQYFIVEDGYGSVFHSYENALYEFLKACKANGRLDDDRFKFITRDLDDG